SGQALRVRSHEQTRETSAGVPLAFVAETDLAGVRALSEGRIADGRLTLTSRMPGTPEREQQLPWPSRALLPEGLRLALLAAPREAGSTIELVTWDSTTLRAQPLQWTSL